MSLALGPRYFNWLEMPLNVVFNNLVTSVTSRIPQQV
jgi:hypothetical protein